MNELRKVKYLTSGNFCDIYTAEYRGLTVAVKVPQDDLEAHEIAQLDNELSILQKISHPNCVHLIGSGEIPGKKARFLVLEFLSGGDLNKFFNLTRKKNGILRRSKKTTIKQRLEMCIQLANALKYIHEDCVPGYFIVHRDLKPHNIGITKDGDIKLMDFGLSKYLKNSNSDFEVYTMTGETGTPRYMPPEVALSKPYNKSVDTYSFAIICWQMLSLNLPFDDMNLEDFIPLVVEDGIRPVCPSHWPEDISKLLHDCWQTDYSRRPSFSEVTSSLESIYLNLCLSSSSKKTYF